MTRNKTTVLAAILSLAAVTPLGARAQQWPYPYGVSIGVDAARKAAVAAVAEAKKNGWNMAVAVVDTSGTLVYFEKMDQTQIGSVRVSMEKARSAVEFRRATKSFEDLLNSGKSFILGLSGAVPLEGGLPVVLEGKIVGAIGVSGGNNAQDGMCAKAGASALGPQPQPGAAPAK